jgi:hypothetical protein
MYEVGYRWTTFAALEDIAYLLAEAGQHAEVAVRLMGAAEAIRQEISIDVAPNDEPKQERAITQLRQQLGDDAFAALWQAGKATPLAEIVNQASLLTLT